MVIAWQAGEDGAGAAVDPQQLLAVLTALTKKARPDASGLRQDQLRRCGLHSVQTIPKASCPQAGNSISVRFSP